MKLLLADWMKELDNESINTIGIPSIVLMENASRGGAEFFAREFPLESGFKKFVVVVGKGNNGGDGLAVGRILHQMGYSVAFVLLASPEKLNPDPQINFNIVRSLGLEYAIVGDRQQLDESFARFTSDNERGTVVVDALFGTGLDRPVKTGMYSRAIELINECGCIVAAIDIPSGLSEAFLPEEGIHVNANVTATFQCLKTVHLHPDGNKYCGRIHVVDIGIPNERVNQDKYYINIITDNSIRFVSGKRAVDAHKGSFGHGLTVAGSIDKPGAGVLSSFALLKSGAGLCTAAVPFENRLAAVAAHPELMTLVYEKPTELVTTLKQFNVVLAGPGLGDNEITREIVSLLLKNTKVPIVLDADALNALAHGKKTGDAKYLFKDANAPVIITPHPGEFSRLTGLSVSEINRNRIAVARDYARSHQVYVVLKGHHTVIATPNGQVYVNATGNPGMATAGSGDVLGGMIAGMLCSLRQTQPIEAILQAAVFLHGYAGDLASHHVGEMCLTAGDIIDFIPDAVAGLDTFDAYENGISFNFTR